MTKIPNKKTIALNRLEFGICDLPFDLAQGGELVEPFVIWCLDFVILDTKRQGKAIFL